MAIHKIYARNKYWLFLKFNDYLSMKYHHEIDYLQN